MSRTTSFNVTSWSFPDRLLTLLLARRVSMLQVVVLPEAVEIPKAKERKDHQTLAEVKAHRPNPQHKLHNVSSHSRSSM